MTAPDVTSAVERVRAWCVETATDAVRQPGVADEADVAVAEAMVTILSELDRLSAALGEAREALENIASDDKPELGNRNTNDLLARMYWLWATEAVAKIDARTALQQQEARDGRE